MATKQGFELRTDVLARAARELVAELKQDSSKVMVRIGRNFTLDCVRFTPPFGNAPSTETLTRQRRIGEEAVGSDIDAAFRPLLDWVKANASLETIRFLPFFTKPENARVLREIETYAVAGNLQAVLTILERTKHLRGVIPSATPDRHRTVRGSRGRVLESAKKAPFLVEDGDSIKRLIAAKQRLVGLGKAGWAKAAAGLGLRLPRYITRFAAPGEFKATLGVNWPRLVIGNQVETIQAAGRELRVIPRAIRNRVRNLRRELEEVVAANLRKKNGVKR